MRQFTTERGAEPGLVDRIVEPWFWEIVNDARTYRQGKALKGKRPARKRSPSKTLKSSKATSTNVAKDLSNRTTLEAIASAGSAKGQMQAGVDALAARRQGR